MRENSIPEGRIYIWKQSQVVSGKFSDQVEFQCRIGLVGAVTLAFYARNVETYHTTRPHPHT